MLLRSAVESSSPGSAKGGTVALGSQGIAALAHGLEGVHAQAWGSGLRQRALGAAGACEVVAALLAAPLTLEEASLAEKSLRAMQVLCRHGADKSTRDELNEAALGAAGVCPGERV